ncbi:hypothetical protein FF124_00880 [Martelella lutilitoris]|uniref:Uncharacterized protein n=1 Tax=Martelella lutilitoris TaxID=2583532 RepID=A0A5C4JWG0_9HYPH|nr:hypothetical protein [Martelella lutilitoris]TNB49547.1 hypothetical protein FF124_00880 [Martelella lutilitoris]
MVEKKKTGSRSDDVEVDVTPTEARHSERGRPVLVILASGLVLAFLVWGAVELFAPRGGDPAVETVTEDAAQTEQAPAQ